MSRRPAVPTTRETSGTLTLLAGEGSRQILVPILADTLDENNETFLVNLTNPVNASISDPSANGTINDEDATPTVSISDVAITEGNAGTPVATFDLTLSAASGRGVSVGWATSPGTASAGSDYTTASGTAFFGPGATSTQVSVNIAPDAVDEDNETFSVILSSPVNASVNDGTGIGTINDDDAPPVFSINSVSVGEGAGSAAFTVTKTGATQRTATVTFRTTAGTAQAGADFTSTTIGVAFLAGETSKQVPVPISGDAFDEDNETFTGSIDTPTNATIDPTAGSGTATILDDDPPPLLNIGNVAVTEGNSGQVTAAFQVTLTGPTQKTVSVDYATSDETASAAAGDYASQSGTLTFPPGATSRSVNVLVNGDTVDELNETFAVTLANPSNASPGAVRGTGTINDDDPLPVLNIGDVTVTEGDAGEATASFQVTKGATAQQVTVNYATGDGSAAAGSDYDATSGTLTFAPAESSKTVDVPVNGDTTDEFDENFTVTLSAPTNATVGDGTGTGTITDDDPDPQLDIDDVTVTEGDSGDEVFAEFHLTRTGATDKTISVDVATSPGDRHAPTRITPRRRAR